MAKSAIIGRIIQLAQRLGANPSKFAGTRSNITFLGSGPSNELFSQSLRINELPGLFVAGTGKLKPQILSKVESGAAFAMANKLSTPQLKTLESGLKAMDNLRLGLVKPRGIINTESFRELGRRGAKGSEFREMGIALKAQKAKGFKEAMEAADDLIIEGSGGLITRSQLKNLSPDSSTYSISAFLASLKAKLASLTFEYSACSPMINSESPGSVITTFLSI